MNKEQIDAMLTACLPGGDSCDPQIVADDIRDWFKCQSNDAEPAPMKTKHTPGPWYLKHAHPAIIAARKNGDDRFPVPDENWHWGISRISTPAGDFVVTADLQDTPARREANARLIAAAPEQNASLVECADFIRAFLVDYGDKLLSPAAKAGTEAMLKRAQASLARANP